VCIATTRLTLLYRMRHVGRRKAVGPWGLVTVAVRKGGQNGSEVAPWVSRQTGGAFPSSQECSERTGPFQDDRDEGKVFGDN